MRCSFALAGKAGDLRVVFQILKKILYSYMPISAAVICVYSLFRIEALVGELFSSSEKQ